MRGQAGTEYLVIVGFITFAVIAIVALSSTYSSQIQDKLIINQIDSFAYQLINSAESVFYAGEPSKAPVNLFLPKQVTAIDVYQNEILITVQLSSGENVLGYDSDVPLTGTIPVGEGTKRIILEAQETELNISVAS